MTITSTMEPVSQKRSAPWGRIPGQMKSTFYSKRSWQAWRGASERQLRGWHLRTMPLGLCDVQLSSQERAFCAHVL